MNRRRPWTGRTLRGRLTAGLVVVLLLACAVTGVATAVFLRGFLVNRLDAQLASAGGRYSASLEHDGLPTAGGDHDADNVVPGQSVGTLGVRVADGRITDAAVVAPDGRNAPLLLTRADRSALQRVPVDGHAHTVSLNTLGDYRVQAVRGVDGDVQVTGLPLHEVNEILGRLTVIEVALFALVAVASGVAAAVFVRRTLQPLERVADTALHVSDLPLTDSGITLPSGIAPPEPASEVDRVSVAFEHMLDHLRHALGERDRTEAQLRRFVADASHELRTPLATIRAYAEFAARSDTALSADTAAALDRIDAAAVRMATLVDDLLLLARLDAGRPLAREPLDLTQLVVEAVVDARTAAADHRWQLELPDEPVTVVGDAPRLHQVVANLLGNAAVHTPAGTTVATSLVSTPTDVRLEVCDDGPGVAPEVQADLFDRFTRADPARGTGSGSTGLGLAIAQSIAAAHLGMLTVDSCPGRTCFTLTLPRAGADDEVADDSDLSGALSTSVDGPQRAAPRRARS